MISLLLNSNITECDYRSKQIKIKTINKCQFIGIEDAVIKYSKGLHTKFTYNATCQSAEVLWFYFRKEKAFDKLESIGSLQYIIESAKLNRSRMERLILNSLTIEKRIKISTTKPLKIILGNVVSSMKQKLKDEKDKALERKLKKIVFGPELKPKVENSKLSTI